jgi:NAD(P)-dependent dehydrogenase (short-subunit alcohol dehydrogenase family)
MPSALIIGAGPGIGRSVARRFAREGYAIGVIARSPATLDDVFEALAESGVDVAGATADAADEAALRNALNRVTGRLGVPDVLVYNAGWIRMDEIGDLPQAVQADAWAVNVGGALTAAGHLLPQMAGSSRPTFLLTGGMPEPYPGMVTLSLGKAALRSLTHLLDLEFGPAGVHVATVTVGGRVETGGDYDPDAIAEVYWELHEQPPSAWQREVGYHAGGRRTAQSSGSRLG